MKKETVNVFDQGLNKDLNPIVTPNNVLTDNLNGTFITFNGDELSLQNDAGNTRIPVPDTEDSVKLSDGFYPIGMKEYGGVLYIVAGKKGVNGSGNLDPKFDEIEFGSYPSPELANYTTFKGEKSVILAGDKNNLYKSYIINEDYFKTGRYIKFNYTTFNSFNNVWTPTNNTGLYKIKLLLQLDNGVIDLTDNVWERFNDYKESNSDDTANHWLLSKDFIYHCPYSYKGKLAVQVELNEPIFKIIKYYDIKKVLNGYEFKVDMEMKNTGPINITHYNLVLNVDSSPNPIEVLSVAITNNIFTVVYTVPDDTKILNYEITPSFQYNLTDLVWEDLPSEFRNNYILKGSILLEDIYFNISFKTLDGVCNQESGEKQFKIIALWGEDGYINKQLVNSQPTEKPYVFIQNGYSNSIVLQNYNIIGYYTIDTNTKKISGITPISEQIRTDFENANNGSWGVIEDKIKQVAVIISDPTCSQGKVFIDLSAPVDMITSNKIKYGTLTLFQDNSAEFLKYWSADGKRFEVIIDLTRNLEINYYDSAYSPIRVTIHSSRLQEDAIFKLGLIIDINNIYVEKVNTKKAVFAWHVVKDQAASALYNYIIDQTGTNIPLQERYTLTAYPQPSNTETSTILSYNNLKLEGFPSEYKNFIWFALIPANDYSINYIWNWQIPKTIGGEYENVVVNYAYVKLGKDNLGYILVKDLTRITVTSSFNTITNISN